MKNPSKEPDWNQLRSRLPVLQKKTYLNSCSYGALANEVEASLQRYLDDRNDKGADWDYWVGRNDSVRNSMARLLGADADEVAITASVSAGINSLASALSFDGPRNKVVITDFEFPTNAQIWYAQESRGARIVRLTEKDGRIPLEKFAQAVDEETLIVATAQHRDVVPGLEMSNRVVRRDLVSTIRGIGNSLTDVQDLHRGLSDSFSDFVIRHSSLSAAALVRQPTADHRHRPVNA